MLVGPRMSSDIILLMRTNLPPDRRGLSSSEIHGVWYLAEDYPEKIKQAAEHELKGQWTAPQRISGSY